VEKSIVACAPCHPPPTEKNDDASDRNDILIDNKTPGSISSNKKWRIQPPTTGTIGTYPKVDIMGVKACKIPGNGGLDYNFDIPKTFWYFLCLKISYVEKKINRPSISSGNENEKWRNPKDVERSIKVLKMCFNRSTQGRDNCRLDPALFHPCLSSFTGFENRYRFCWLSQTSLSNFVMWWDVWLVWRYISMGLTFFLYLSHC